MVTWSRFKPGQPGSHKTSYFWRNSPNENYELRKGTSRTNCKIDGGECERVNKKKKGKKKSVEFFVALGSLLRKENQYFMSNSGHLWIITMWMPC